MPDLRPDEYVAANVGVAATVAELQGFTRHVANSVAVLLGDAEAFDDGESGLYIFDAASEDADDGSATIKPDDVDAEAAGRWRKVVSSA